MKQVTDQMGREIVLSDHPRRIISLVPSQTELLFDLGLDNEIVGLTRFCIHPSDKVRAKERIGGTKDFDIEKIIALKPDLIIGNKEENYEEGITELQKHFPVWMSDIATLDDAYRMMTEVGKLTNHQEEAEILVKEIQFGLEEIKSHKSKIINSTCAYFIWRKPYMVAARGTFIDHMLGVFGLRNAFADIDRYPEVTAAQIAASKPDLIFLSSEPYSFSERHIAEFQQICPDARIHIVDGEMFSWYGSRLRYVSAYLKQLRNAIVIPR